MHDLHATHAIYAVPKEAKPQHHLRDTHTHTHEGTWVKVEHKSCTMDVLDQKKVGNNKSRIISTNHRTRNAWGLRGNS